MDVHRNDLPYTAHSWALSGKLKSEKQNYIINWRLARFMLYKLTYIYGCNVLLTRGCLQGKQVSRMVCTDRT